MRLAPVLALALALVVLPAAAQAEWGFTDTYAVASAPVDGMRLVVDCSRPGGRAQFRVDGFRTLPEGAAYTGDTAFLLGDAIDDVYSATCTEGSCLLRAADNAPAARQAAAMSKLLGDWRTRARIDVLEYRGRTIGTFDMTGSAAAITELEAAGCRMP